MKTRKWIAVAVCGLTLGLTVAAADDAKRAKIEELLKVMKTESMTEQMFGQMKGMMASQMKNATTPENQKAGEELSNKILAMVQERMSWTKMKPEYIRIYEETFSDEEVSGMLAFYQTPVGQAMLEKMPTVMAKSMEIGRRMMGDLMPEIQRMTSEMREKEQHRPPNK